MNTSRPSPKPSVNSSGSTASLPRRVKVAGVAKMDLPSIGFPPKTGSLQDPNAVRPTNSIRRPSSTVSSYNGSNYGYPPHNTSSGNISSNNSGNNGYSNTNSLNTSSNNSSSNTPPRLAPSVRSKSSTSVATIASFRSTNGANGGGTGSSSQKDTGSVTSDDGTVSEDSDRTADDIHLFSGGQAGVGGGINLPFVSSGRPLSSSGSICGMGPKISAGGGNMDRHRKRSSTIGLSSLSSGNSAVGTTPKPMRIAASTSLKFDSNSSSHSNHASISSSHSSLGISTSGSAAGSLVGTATSHLTPSTSMHSWSSASHLGVSSNRNGFSRNGDDASSAVSMNSAISSSQQPTIRSIKINSAATAVAAASKLAEENRRAEEAARTRRKIADLEISNASLLSINQSLEATMRKQASEVQELKASFGDSGHIAADLALAQSIDAIELTEAESQDDLTFKRLCLSVEQMVYEAKHALDQTTKPTGVKVLTLYDLYEKEVAEEAEAEEVDEDEADHSFVNTNQGHNREDHSIEVIDQDEYGQGGVHSQIEEPHGNSISIFHGRNSMIISSAALDTPLTMVT
ncbi:hypothetical protein EDD21DRAFT_411540 [Dissophora ornata]|nr:hypothetical protein EDD21DRAFT_411540 [Dissophora ornata]